MKVWLGYIHKKKPWLYFGESAALNKTEEVDTITHSAGRYERNVVILLWSE